MKQARMNRLFAPSGHCFDVAIDAGMFMPLMVDPLVMQDNARGGYMVDGNIDLILPLVRQAAEMGADIIKADPSTNVQDYHRVVAIAQGLPVLVRGGGRVKGRPALAGHDRPCHDGAYPCDDDPG